MRREELMSTTVWRSTILVGLAVAVVVLLGGPRSVHASGWWVGPHALTASADVAQQPPTRRRGVRGPLPDWAAESWFIRRMVDPPWVLASVHVIDIETGAVQRDVNITIAADRILSISNDVPAAGAKVVDGDGGWVIPGLFDLHAHVMPKSIFFPAARSPEETLVQLLEAGVTTIRALPIYSESALGWAAEVNRGALAGPTIVPSGSIFEKEPQRTSRGFHDVATAVAWVRKEALLGARWIKVYNTMDEASLRAIVETAREYGASVCGHANSVPPHRAAAIGMGTIEHAVSIAYSCLRDDAPEPPGYVGLTQSAWCWDHADPEKLAALMETFRRHGTGWVPTLVVLETLVGSGIHDRRAMDEGVLESFRNALTESARLAVTLHRAGGLVGIGTDFPVDGVVAGASVHRELQLMVEGGATPLEALQMGTISSARILGFGDLLGSVSEGKLAHIVVLERNPLEDITNTTAIRAVVHDGRLHEPSGRPKE